MKRIAALLIIAAAASVGSATAQHHPTGGGAIAATDAWARATPGAARAGAAYLTITNAGGTADRLVAVRTEAARRPELHTHIMDGTVMRMRKVDGIDLPAGGTVTLKPGGNHVMLMGLKAPLTEGMRFPLTLVLASGKSVAVSVSVLKLGAMGPAMHGHGAMPGMKAN